MAGEIAVGETAGYSAEALPPARGAGAAAEAGGINGKGPKGTSIFVRSLGSDPIQFYVGGQQLIGDLKDLIQEQLGLAPKLQRLLLGKVELEDDERIAECGIGHGMTLMLLTLDSDPEEPLFTWDVAGNPDVDMLEGDGPIVTCTKLQRDCVNVVTTKPIEKGVHYFQFIMHNIGDEQCCGLTADPAQAGRKYGGFRMSGSYYDCGDVGSGCDNDALQIGGENLAWRIFSGTFLESGKSGTFLVRGQSSVETLDLSRVQSKGDVIGMLVNTETNPRYVAFDLNGRHQETAAISSEPMWILSHVRMPQDKVELRKLPIADAPPESLCPPYPAPPRLERVRT